MRQLPFKRHRFPPPIIHRSVWLYARFTLSYRDVGEMLAGRGLDVSYETLRRRFLKFGPVIAANLRRARPWPSDHWHFDEMAIVPRLGATLPQHPFCDLQRFQSPASSPQPTDVQKASNPIVRGLATREHGGLNSDPNRPSCEILRLM